MTISARQVRELVGRDDELCVYIPAHSVDGAGSTGPYRIGVAAGMLGGNGDGAIRTADDRTIVIKGIFGTEIDDETGVLGAPFERDAGADFNAERLVGFGVRKVRSRRRACPTASFDLNRAGRGRGAAGICSGTDAGRIGSGADVTLNLLFGILAANETNHKQWKDEQTT